MSAPSPRDAELLGLAGRRLLIVDDNLTSRRVLGDIVERWDMRVTACATVEEAGELLQQPEPFELLLIDHGLDGEDGFELVHRMDELAKIGKLGRAPAVAMMAPLTYQLESERMARLKGIVNKPIRPRLWGRALVAMESGIPEDASRPLMRVEPPKVPVKSVRRLRVLVAEDNLVNQELMRLMLKSLGHESMTVDDGAQVLPALRNDNFDVVLMDVQIPGMDGFEATKVLREHFERDGRSPWVVAVTANAMAGDRERCLEAGMNAYISKPVEVRQLEEVLARAKPSFRVLS
ncbi:MAG: response regulator [Candidatus Synoicihabitans palmerolidicus]|nr:response regulator [Candidatus Synoicihabitans palmerolidicus]